MTKKTPNPFPLTQTKPKPMTDSEIAATLSAVLKDVQEYQTELAALPAAALPADYDAVNMAEWTDTLSIRARACERVACFLGSFWESHHMLAAQIPYERAIRVWFDWAADCLTNEIENHS
jgi:hypothetical protein